MAFKPNPNKKVRLEDLNKTKLIATVRTLQRRESKLLSQIAKLEGEARGRRLREVSSVAGTELDDALERVAAAKLPGFAFPWETDK